MVADVVVVGSANLDLVLRVERVPAPGETVNATGREEHVGGKGLNQAVAAARTGIVEQAKFFMRTGQAHGAS